MNRVSFRSFCEKTDSGFYTSRPKLLELADVMDCFVRNGKTSDVLNISLPTRFGKSRIATDFTVYLLICDRYKRILRASYSADLAETFSEQVKSRLADFYSTYGIEFSTVGTRSRWKIAGNSEYNHIGTGVAGTITGFGCDIAIIDDTAKNMADATSAAYRRQLDSFRESVLYGRLEGMRKIINVGTRWAVNDWFSNFADAQSFVLPAIDESGHSCCENWKTTEELLLEKSRVRPFIWDAQYQQRPTAVGRVRIFEGFVPPTSTYTGGELFAVIDPATDFGSDYFVVGIYQRIGGGLVMVDMFARQRATVKDAADFLRKWNPKAIFCEANGVGRNIISEFRKFGITNIIGFCTKSDKYSRAVLRMDDIRTGFYISTICDGDAVNELLRQFDEFPIGEHDDLTDNVVMAFERIFNR